MISVAEEARKAEPADEPVAPPSDATKARYRADIDGLRALAVVSVILTHAGVAGVEGGFIGVDIFFVISGYLIYGDLMRRLGEVRLSVVEFYGRRMRRTLPALYLVCASTLLAAAFVMMPGDLDALARSLIATVLLVPNIFFLFQTGYFDTDALSKPLLHTWSLGVEEQFYLLAPLLALALYRLAFQRRRDAALVLMIVGVVLCVVIRHASRNDAFYLMPARAFEFLAGALIVEQTFPRIRERWLAEAAAFAALLAIAESILTFDYNTPHPGLATLVPCLATAIIIHVGSGWSTFTGRLLGLRPVAFIGLISYSLYLWHWPMLVLARYALVPTTAPFWIGGTVLLFGLSVASWKFVEKPFRRPGSVLRLRAPIFVPLGATVLIATCGLVGVYHGFPGRFPPDVAAVAEYYGFRDSKPFREGQCFITSKDDPSAFDRSVCLGLSSSKPNVLLIGDSHAAHLWTALRDTWPDVNVLQATASGCKPTIGTLGTSRCTSMMKDMLERFIPANHLDAVIIAALWEENDIKPLEETIEALKPHVGRVVVFGPVPQFDAPAATLIANAMLRGRLSEMQNHILPENEPLDEKMQAAIAPTATYVSAYKILCPNGLCRLFASPSVPMQFDVHHLTPAGADVMMAEVKKRFPALLKRP